MKAELTCYVCGKKYKACPKCDELKGHGIRGWRLNCDTPECYQVFCILEDYKAKRVTKAEAKEQLTRCLRNDMRPYHPGAQPLIAEIMRTEPPVVKTADAPKPKTAFTPSIVSTPKSQQ